MRLVLLGHAPVLGGSTDLLFQVRDYFQRAHDVKVVFGEGADPMDPRAKDATILQLHGKDWRDDMRAYVAAVESLQPDIAYGISGPRELDLFRFLRCVRVRHFSALEQHGYVDIPFWLAETKDYYEGCTANTPDAMEELHRHTGLPSFLLPYRLPAALDRETAAIPTHADPAKPVEIAFVGRLERFQKRAHWLPAIVRRCREAGANLQWHIYGDGPEAGRLGAKLRQESNVNFHGWMNRDALYERLPRHDIFFLCSRWEGLPIAMVEALRCGLACVAPDIASGIHWTLSHGGGWLYNASSPRAAANALINAASDRALLLEKRREAQRLSVELFPASHADEAYAQLEASFKTLKSNGRALDIATAPKFRQIPASAYLRRLGYAVEIGMYSPGLLLSAAAKRLKR